MAGVVPDPRSAQACHALMGYLRAMLTDAQLEERQGQERLEEVLISRRDAHDELVSAAEEYYMRPTLDCVYRLSAWRTGMDYLRQHVWQAKDRHKALKERATWYADELERLNRLGARPPRQPMR